MFENFIMHNVKLNFINDNEWKIVLNLISTKLNDRWAKIVDG